MRRQLPCSLLTDSSTKHLSEEINDVRALKMMSGLKFELSLTFVLVKRVKIFKRNYLMTKHFQFLRMALSVSEKDDNRLQLGTQNFSIMPLLFNQIGVNSSTNRARACYQVQTINDNAKL